MLSALTSMVLRVLGLGAVLAAVSEVWYYPVTFSWGLLELCAYYGVLAYLCWFLLARFGAGGLAAGFVAACLFGFLIEGVPVGHLYTALPFTLVWTSTAWHALIAVAIGLWLFRRVMSQGSLLAQIGFCVAAGIYLAATTVELWTLPEDDAPWIWPDIYTYWTQQLAGWGMFIAGHLLLNMTARFTVRPARWELPVFGGLVLLMFLLQNAWLWFPLSLILPVVTLLCVWLIWRARGHQPAASLVRITNWSVPIFGIMVSLLIPLSATLTHLTLATYDIRLEGSAIHIMWAGPASVVLLLWSALRILRPRGNHSQ